MAQIGACFLCNIFGIVADKESEEKNDISYLRGWASYLRESSKTEISRASCQAQKAAQYFIETAEKQLAREKSGTIYIHADGETKEQNESMAGEDR